MKRYHSLIFALFAAVLLGVNARAYGDAAFAALPFDGVGSGVTTVITDTEGASHRFDGALDAAALDDHAAEAVRIASYALEFEGAELLNVELHGFEAAEPERGGLSLLGVSGATSHTLRNGYFAASFDYDAGDFVGCEVFLTGLGQNQLAELIGKMVSAKLNFQKFDLTDLDFIDAEKLSVAEAGDGSYSNDSELCWAATTSNILHYTGWAAKAEELHPEKDFSSEDKLMNEFVAGFTDGPGHVSFGLSWFFNGKYDPEDDPERYDASQWARRRQVNSGGYLDGYPVSSYIEVLEADADPSLIGSAAERLREGWGIGVALAWYEPDETEEGPATYTRDGGHAITFWGYIRRKNAEAFDRGNYLALLAADSDSDPTKQRKTNPSDDRTTAPDMLCLMPLNEADIMGRAESETGYRAMHGLWVTAAQSGKRGILEDFIILKPFDDSYPTDAGTFDRKISPDLTIEAIVSEEERHEPIYFSDCAEDVPFDGGYRTVFAAGSDMSVYLRLVNNSGSVPYIAPVKYALALSRDGGDFEEKGTGVTADNTYLKASMTQSVDSERVALGTLDAGAYTLRVTIIPLSLTEYQAYPAGLAFTELWTLVDMLTDAHPLEYLSAVEGRTISEITSDYYGGTYSVEDAAAYEADIVYYEEIGYTDNAAALRSLPRDQLAYYLEYYGMGEYDDTDVRARLIALTVGLDHPETYAADALPELYDVLGEKLQTLFTEAYYTNNSRDFDFTVTDAAADLGDVSLTLAGDITPIDEHYYHLPLTVTGLDEDFAENCYTTIHYYYNGAWNEDVQDWDAQPYGAEINVRIQGLTKVRLRMQLQPKDPELPWPVLTKELTLSGRCWFYVSLGAAGQFTVEKEGEQYYIEKDGEKYYIEQVVESGYLIYYAVKDETRFRIENYIGCDYDLCQRKVRPWAPWSSSNVIVASYDPEGRMVSAVEQDVEEYEVDGQRYARTNWVPYGGNVSTIELFWLGADDFAPKSVPITIH